MDQEKTKKLLREVNIGDIVEIEYVKRNILKGEKNVKVRGYVESLDTRTIHLTGGDPFATFATYPFQDNRIIFYESIREYKIEKSTDNKQAL